MWGIELEGHQVLITGLCETEAEAANMEDDLRKHGWDVKVVTPLFSRETGRAWGAKVEFNEDRKAVMA
eukprot:6391811-Pyramimonas_sp.AAC.1